MKLLYVSSYHPTLEYNDLKLFEELGIDWFSTGIYANTEKPLSQTPWLNSGISKKIDEKILADFYQLNPSHRQYGEVKLTAEFVKQFDAVLCSFCFVQQNCLGSIWPHCKDVPVCLVTYSQQMAPYEKVLKNFKIAGLKIIRGSPRESTIVDYAGHDAIIRCYVDENMHKDYVGGDANVLSFANDFPPRINHPNYNCYRVYYKYIKPNLPCMLYGHQSESAGGYGVLPYNELVEKYKTCGCYFSIGSPPATVTYNFLEAWITGAPVVAYGPKLGNGVGLLTHEVPYLIDSGINGFCSDDIPTLINISKILLQDRELASKIGKEGRKKAIEIFGKETVKKQWINFFEDKMKLKV